MRVLMIVSLSAICACSGDSTPTPEGVRDASSVASALLKSLAFDDAETRSGDLPGTDDEGVLLLPLVDTVLMTPGQPSIMPLNLFNPNTNDAVVATLMKFGSAPDHVRVPVPDASGSAGDVDNPVQVSDEVCDGLCARAYLVKVAETLELASGKIGKHAERTVLLDCREDPLAVACDGDEEATPDASVNEALDASLPVAARVRMGLIDTVKAVCACDVALRPVALVCAGKLAAAGVDCHIAALEDYAATSLADLQCGIDGADSAPGCLAACDPMATPACLAELTACGVDLAEVERVLLGCETFTCADRSDDIDGSLLCDGKADCADASDEGSPTCDGVNPPPVVP